MSPNSSSHSRHQSRQILWWIATVLAMVGIGLAVELTRIHLRLQIDPAHRSFCNVNATVNCDAVSKSSYSILLGLPVSVWGALAYTASLVVSLWGLRTGKRAQAALWTLGLGCVAGAVYFASVSLFVLRTWCLLCMVTWVIDFGLFGVATALVRDQGLAAAFDALTEWLRRETKRVVILGAIGVVTLGVCYRFFAHSGAELASTASAASLTLPSGKPPEGLDPSGQPYVGATQPKLTIVEFSDYQCPHCAHAHEQLRRMVSAYPDAVRVVHRHFPLDNDCNPKIPRPFHMHACYYARLAVCAAALGKFWQGNDYLFAHGRDEVSVAIDSFAKAIETPSDQLRECLTKKADEMLKRDVEAGAKLDIDGTPTFLINGEKSTGELPREVLRDYPI